MRCHFCGGFETECGGMCVSKTAEMDVAINGVIETRLVTYETVPVVSTPHRKLTARDFWAWPEWQAVLKRLDLPPAIQNLTLTLNCREPVRLEIKAIGAELPCQQPHAGTPPMDSSEAGLSIGHRQHSEDTTAIGHD